MAPLTSSLLSSADAEPASARVTVTAAGPISKPAAAVAELGSSHRRPHFILLAPPDRARTGRQFCVRQSRPSLRPPPARRPAPSLSSSADSPPSSLNASLCLVDPYWSLPCPRSPAPPLRLELIGWIPRTTATTAWTRIGVVTLKFHADYWV